MEYTFLDFLTLIGSVGLFLYGMKVMSEGLQKVAGDGADLIDTNANWIDGHYAGIFEWDSSASKFGAALEEIMNDDNRQDGER